MADSDVFERRLRAALVRHVEDGPLDFDALDFARTVATTEPRRHGVGTILGWRGTAVPRVAWVVLLSAALLAALVGAMLMAGSRPEPTFPAVVPPVGQVFTCPPGSTPDKAGPVGQARPPLADATAMAFDRRAGRIVALAGEGDHAQTWTFDVCTNTWARMADGPAGLGSDQLVYDAASDLTITVDRATGRVWAYDLASDKWTARGPFPVANSDGGKPLLVYDPVSGDVVTALHTDLWSYDVERDEWTTISTVGSAGGVLIAYDTSADRLVAYDLAPHGRTTGTRLFDVRTGAWTQPGVIPPGGVLSTMTFNWWATGNEITYDEAAQRTVIFSAGRMIAYDAAADRWTEVFAGAPAEDGGICPGSLCRLNATTIYDPVNERLVVYGGSYRDPTRILADPEHQWVQDDGVIAFDLATRTWNVLVEATRTQSSPG